MAEMSPISFMPLASKISPTVPALTARNMTIMVLSIFFSVSSVIFQSDVQLGQFTSDERAGDGGQFVCMAVVRHASCDLFIRKNPGMEVDLGQALVQAVQNLQDVVLGHAARIEHSFDLAGIADPEFFQVGAGMSGQGPEDDPFDRLAGPPLPVKAQVVAQSFAGQPEAGDAVVRHQFGQEGKNRRVQMDIEVSVNMGEGDAAVYDPLYLGLDFLFELFVESLVEKIAHAGGNRIVAEFPGFVHQIRYLRVRQHGFALQQGQVQADLQPGIAAGNLDRLAKTGTGRHDRGAGQDAVAPGLFNGPVDAAGKAEIVGCDDETTHILDPFVLSLSKHEWFTLRQAQGERML